jgi:hypothetical protein
VREATEQDIQKAILDYLKLKKFVVFKHRNVGIYKKDTNHYIPLAFGEKGIAEIIACAPGGRFWAIEVKKPGGEAIRRSNSLPESSMRQWRGRRACLFNRRHYQLN